MTTHLIPTQRCGAVGILANGRGGSQSGESQMMATFYWTGLALNSIYGLSSCCP
ncbi:MAG: hypothetical protein J07HR59_01429 [Halorubrum sp. J07HR59]|nr:MAG: hypothetical protein J07HR59_01429 [Halorubrum sp. J07HR59]